MSEKTEKPSTKKLQDARNKGQSPKSADLAVVAVLIGSLLVLSGSGKAIFERLSRVIATSLERGLQVESDEAMLAVVHDMLMDGMAAVLPLVCVSVLVAVTALFVQIGFRISFEPIKPNFDTLNPATGFKKLFGVRPLVELAKSLVKAVALASVVWVIVRGLMPLLVGSAYLDVMGAGSVAWDAMLHLIAAACLVFVVIAPVDFGLQRWLFRRDQKMSKDEVKRERKDAEGDPQIKGERRSLQEEMATNPPEKRVPGATVVITNPTHYAVAVRYDSIDAPVPVVVAKGIDEQALRIRQIAAEHGVPVVGNPPLARALHKLPLDQPVPEALFESVAVVLRWVADIDRLGGRH